MPDETGVFFAEQTVESLSDVIERFEEMDWSPLRIRTHAEQYDRVHFAESILQIVEHALAGRL